MFSDSTITSKGQTTVPKEVRKNLHLRSGSRLVWIKKSDTEYIVSTTVPLMSLQGMLQSPLKKPATIEEMNAAIAEGAAQGYLNDRD